MSRTVSDLIDELSWCADAIEREAKTICARPEDWEQYMATYLDTQSAHAMKAGSVPLVYAFRAARDAVSLYSRGIAIDILRGASVRLHRQYMAETLLP